VSTSEPTETHDVTDEPESTEESTASATDVESPDGGSSPEVSLEDSQGAGESEGNASQRVTQLEEELSALQEERDAINDKFLRKAAELENFRRRMERESTRRYKAGQIDVVKAVLGVLDDMGRSMDAAEELRDKQDAETAYESLKGGIEMVHSRFLDDLESLGVERIDAEGEAFDEALHEAMMQQPAPDDVEPGTVLNEVQAGYRMGDRVIRHSRVIVAT